MQLNIFEKIPILFSWALYDRCRFYDRYLNSIINVYENFDDETLLKRIRYNGYDIRFFNTNGAFVEVWTVGKFHSYGESMNGDYRGKMPYRTTMMRLYSLEKRIVYLLNNDNETEEKKLERNIGDIV